MESAMYFSAMAGNRKVDTDAGIITGVSVMTAGECAGAHKGTFVDDITLSQLVAVASQFKDGIKVKMSQVKEHDGSVGQICGILKNFRIDGSQARADMTLLKSDSNYNKILELSATAPETFGLSVSVPKNYEDVKGSKTLRISDIYSVDIVESPAANRGLFTSKTMDTNTKKTPAELLCEVLALTAEDTAETIKTKLSALAPKPVATDLTELTGKIEAATVQLTALKTETETAKLSAKKAEITGLVSEATREGKVVPLTDEQLAKMEIADIKAMFSKLVPNQIKLSSKRVVEAPKTADGKPVQFDSAEKRIQFCREKQEEGAAKLTADFLANPTLNLSSN